MYSLKNGPFLSTQPTFFWCLEIWMLVPLNTVYSLLPFPQCLLRVKARVLGAMLLCLHHTAHFSCFVVVVVVALPMTTSSAQSRE